MTTDYEHAQRINDSLVADLTEDDAESKLIDRLIADPSLATSMLGALRQARRELSDFAFHVERELRKVPPAGEFDSQSTTLTDLPEEAAERRIARHRMSTQRIGIQPMPSLMHDIRSADASVVADHGIEQRPSLGDVGPMLNDAWDAMTVTQLGQSSHRMPVMFAITALLIACGVAVWFLSSHPGSVRAEIPLVDSP